MEVKHSKEEILAILNSVEVAAVATAAGDRLRNRMMHFAADDDFNLYLATMKGDPKTLQMTNYPSVSLLVHQAAPSINDAQEVEITGKARFVRDETERQKALALTAQRSPVVKYLTETGNAEVLDCIKVAPDTVKYRVFKEIVQGMPPTVVEFPEHRATVSEGELL
ncbi:MAG: pyridoxamine 5'-phosphate oxidase family protein [Chloroflexi bacterium]|nr:pyridoxamine 5'-phosphate oxidase family protein [Chloroflexota bacterium]